MSLTRKQLSEMKEADLQRILFDLFKAKGFQDVHIHQGPGEIGKDIVMWKSGDFGQRINYAVVVKAKKISGSVSSSSGASTVAAQINQCFGKNYLDHVTITDQEINHVYVVSSHEITQESVIAIKSIINNNIINRAVTFIDGDKLWEDLKKYIPEKLVFATLKKLRDLFDKASPDHRIIADTEGKIRIEPKHPGAKPLTVSGSIKLPDTPEGQALQEEINRHVSTGSIVTIPAQFIEDLQIPDFLIPFLGTVKEYELIIKSPESQIPLLIKIEINCDDGEKVSFDYIHLKAIQGGEDEATFNNEEQPVPWKVTMKLNRKERRFTFDFNISFENVNVKQANQGLHFLQAIAKGGTVRIEHLDTGLDIITKQIPPGQFEEADKKRLQLSDKLLFIQQKAKVAIPFNNGPVSIEEAKVIFDTAYVMEFGGIRIKPEPTIVNTKKIEFAKNFVEPTDVATPRPFAVHYEKGPRLEIAGKEIPMGPAIYSWDNVYITENDLNKLKTDIENYSEDKSIGISLTPTEECIVQIIFPQWLPPEEQAALNLELSKQIDNEEISLTSQDQETI